MTRSEETKALELIKSRITEHKRQLNAQEIDDRANQTLLDAQILAGCATSNCLISYSDAIKVRRKGIAVNGKWLDDVYMYALAPLGLPDLTMLVVNKDTKRPSPGAFENHRAKLSNVHIDEIAKEQNRCFWIKDYASYLGDVIDIPTQMRISQTPPPQPSREQEISRAVANAVMRANDEGKSFTKTAKAYPDTLSRADLTIEVDLLWNEQNGRCALTGAKFELRSDEQGGMDEDRLSIDRIDNSQGYFRENIQLVTKFANRARGTSSIAEAKKRLRQFNDA